MPAAQAFGVQVRIFIRHGMPFDRCPVIQITAVFQKLDLGIINAGFDQRLARARARSAFSNAATIRSPDQSPGRSSAPVPLVSIGL